MRSRWYYLVGAIFAFSEAWRGHLHDPALQRVYSGCMALAGVLLVFAAAGERRSAAAVDRDV